MHFLQEANYDTCIDWQGVNILGKWIGSVGVIEAIHIKTYKSRVIEAIYIKTYESDLNHNKGQHRLSSI